MPGPVGSRELGTGEATGIEDVEVVSGAIDVLPRAASTGTTLVQKTLPQPLTPHRAHSGVQSGWKGKKGPHGLPGQEVYRRPAAGESS